MIKAEKKRQMSTLMSEHGWIVEACNSRVKRWGKGRVRGNLNQNQTDPTMCASQPMSVVQILYRTPPPGIYNVMHSPLSSQCLGVPLV